MHLIFLHFFPSGRYLAWVSRSYRPFWAALPDSIVTCFFFFFLFVLLFLLLHICNLKVTKPNKVCEVLGNYSIPSLDYLITPTSDPSVLNQINLTQTKKYVQDNAKEMAVVQRPLLNTKGPLWSLHDTLSSGNQVLAEEVKCIVAQTLCLLGSANHELPVLRRKKVLINKEIISLADQPLPNAKRFLFVEEFPFVASKQAERSRGLAKNL